MIDVTTSQVSPLGSVNVSKYSSTEASSLYGTPLRRKYPPFMLGRPHAQLTCPFRDGAAATAGTEKLPRRDGVALELRSLPVPAPGRRT